MLRLVLFVMVLTLWLILAASLPLQDCVDFVVHGNNSTEIKTFTSKKGELFFFPEQGFESVTIKLVTADRKSTGTITLEDLCVNSSQWYSLEVAVDGKSTYHQCTFKTNYCSGECGSVKDLAFDEFESFSVEANGASFWSLNITQETQCTIPVVTHTTPASSTTPITILVWLAGVGGGAVVLVAVVVTVVCIVQRRIQPIRSSGTQQQEDSPADNSSPLRRNDTVNISSNSLYEPFYNVITSGMKTHQQQQHKEDGSARDISILGRRDSVHTSYNSLYEPFCAVTNSGREVIWRRDGNATDTASTPPAPSVLLGETLQY